MAIMTGTRYDINKKYDTVKKNRKATGDVLTGVIGNMYPGNSFTIVDIGGENPGFKKGDNIRVDQDSISFNAVISDVVIYPGAYYSLHLDEGVQHYTGDMVRGGTVTLIAAPAPSAKSNIVKYLIIGIAVIGAGLLLWKLKKGSK